jgi:hypothetical protein
VVPRATSSVGPDSHGVVEAARRRRGRRVPGPHHARLPADGHPQHGPGRHPGTRRHAALRTHDAGGFERYNIVSRGDLQTAAALLEQHAPNSSARNLGHSRLHSAPSDVSGLREVGA